MLAFACKARFLCRQYALGTFCDGAKLRVCEQALRFLYHIGSAVKVLMNGLTKHIRAKTREVSAPEEVATTTNWLQALTNNEAKSILPVKEVPSVARVNIRLRF